VSAKKVKVVITPSHDEYRGLAADLALLRMRGVSPTNTDAIIRAVRAQADMLRRPQQIRTEQRHLRAA
jgi:anthranilate phosphoribosyltransferase